MFLPHVNPNDRNNAVLRCDMTGSYASLDAGATWRMYNLRTVVYDFAFDPTAPKTVYAASTGLYRSEDGGMSWNLVYPDPSSVLAEHMVGDHAEQWFETVDGMPDQGVTTVLVDPADGNHLWITLGPTWDTNKSRLLVSRNRGATWSMVKSDITGTVLNVFPGNWWDKPDEVIVSTADYMFRVNEQNTDYELLTQPDKPITAIEGGRGAGGMILYCMSTFRLSGIQLFGGVYRSDDRGKTWRTVKNELAADWSVGSTAVPSLTSLAVCESRPEVAYVGCGYSGSSGYFGVFKTVNSGSKWSWVLRHSGNNVIGNNFSSAWMTQYYGPGWAGAPISMGVSPSDPNVAYGTDYGRAYRTHDGGATWQQVYSEIKNGGYATTGLNVTSVYDLAFDPHDTLHLATPYTDIGLWHSTDGGESWKHAITGVPSQWINTCYWVAFDPVVPNKAWAVWSNCHDLPRLKMFRSGTLEANGYAGGVTVTDNGMNNWQLSSSGIPNNTICTHVIIDPKSPSASRTLYVTAFGKNGGVYKSTNGGTSWILKNSGLGLNKYGWRLAILNDGTLFLLVARGQIAGTTVSGALYRSNNAGESWSQVTLPGGADGPNDLIVDPSNPQRLYLSLWPLEDRTVSPRIARNGGLMMSEDGGRTWSRVFREDSYVYAAAMDPSRPGTLYINTFDSAAFRSLDYGQSWQRIRGYDFKWGYRPVVDRNNPGMVYLTTFGGGIHHGPGAGVSGNESIVNLRDEWRWGN